jgi:hypothetical protein
MECEKGAAKTEFGMKHMVGNIRQKSSFSQKKDKASWKF